MYRVVGMGVGLVALFLAIGVQAQEVSSLQSSLRFAREDMMRAQEAQQADAAEVAAWQRRQEEATARLAEAKVRADKSQQRYQEAKARFDKIGGDLEQAWKAQESR